ncbi:MAG: UDP-N-acetylglucosamine 2-epimerase [Desulfobacula sp.]|uniref:UDP-N-acetylglucosamine 2-epimerase n=1 Tax=Desulfobacula sp. TaxID=2593537 RepID=UPI0025C39851|nr:UDP-N-acetylglucosamine 2-epimerase [Desulfobacula sp.]MCD4719761.1 UDP-N-acetylglucosamine 2-epimerase [Desulfobacula sp.]
MKNICIITGTLNEYYILKPLIKKIQEDQSVYLTIISTGKHQTPELEITYRRIEEEGFTIDEKTDIVFNTQKNFRLANPVNFEQLEYDRVLKLLKPDIVILLENSYETFTAAIAASQNNIPIAHIQGGESDFRTWDDSYGYGITKLSHLHFTSTEKYRQQVIRFGEPSQNVFNVGSLLIEKIKTLSLRGKALFYDEIGFNKENQFILVSFHPDASMGSKNGQLFQEVLESLADERLEKFKILFNKPKANGLGKMIIQMIEDFTLNHPGKTISLPFMNLPDLSCAIKYSSALVGNDSDSIIIAPSFKTPVINIGTRQQDRIKAKNIIDCHPQKKEILCAVQNGLSADFKCFTRDMSSPFEQISTAGKIKDIVKEFRRTNITRKAFYSRSLNA